MAETKKTPRLPNKFEAVLPILVLLGIMIASYLLEWGIDAHIPCLIAACVAIAVGKICCGLSYTECLGGALNALSRTLEAIIILFCIGTLIGSWEFAGTIPAVVFYGLKAITPALFLPTACIICAIIGISLGSSWTVTGTVGIAFMSIGAAMGINPAITAGMCISGAYCGDKFSPLSDTTNLAAATSQTGLFDHVRAMVSTTFPSLVVALIIYTAIGINFAKGDYDASVSQELSQAIVDHYQTMSPVLLLPVAVLIAACLLKIPSIPGVLLATLTGVILSVVFQGASLYDCINMCHYGYGDYIGDVTNELAIKLFDRGGMDSMLWTINLVIVAVSFGGILERIGAVESLMGGLIKKVKKPWQLCLTVILTSFVCDWTMCDQYLAIIIPGQMYMNKFDEMGLSRNMLSRSLEDCGTLWSPMCPWNSCGAYQAGVLGMSPFTYMPFAFMNIINPIFAVVSAVWGGNILYADGSYTNMFGKLKQGKTVPAAPADAHEEALKNLEALRANGTYKKF